MATIVGFITFSLMIYTVPQYVPNIVKWMIIW